MQLTKKNTHDAIFSKFMYIKLNLENQTQCDDVSDRYLQKKSSKTNLRGHSLLFYIYSLYMILLLKYDEFLMF